MPIRKADPEISKSFPKTKSPGTLVFRGFFFYTLLNFHTFAAF
jgi:hypothetical protein